MKRRSFFKKLALGASAAAVVPNLFADTNEDKIIIETIGIDGTEIYKTYPITPEECFIRPRIVETKTTVKKISKGVYEVGFSDFINVGDQIIISEKHTNRNHRCMFIVVGKKDGLCTIAPLHNSNDKINGIKIGTLVPIMGSLYMYG